jgi:hypothetical protein
VQPEFPTWALVTASKANCSHILYNKIDKILIIFEQIDKIKT